MLHHSAGRAWSRELAENFEQALSDVILLGDDRQIQLAGALMSTFAETHAGSVDGLLVSLRSELRRELGLRIDQLETVPTLRLSVPGKSTTSPKSKRN